MFNTRSSRSRLSSPQQAPNSTGDATRAAAGDGSGAGGGAATPAGAAPGGVAGPPGGGGGQGGQKTLLQRWLEPPPQSRPSFQEAGLMRHGVVEGMAALGTLPKAAMMKGQKPSAAASAASTATTNAAATATTTAPAQDALPARRIIIKRSETPSTFGGSAAAKDPEPSPSFLPSRRSLVSRGVVLDDDDDDDYEPERVARSSTSYVGTRRTLSRQTALRQAAGGSSPFALKQQSPAQVEPASPESKDSAEKVVQTAVDEALRHFRYPTAWALRTLFDENCNNAQFLSMFEEIYQQTADADTVEEFTRMIHEKKKEGKKDNKGCYFFVPPTTNSRFTPHKPKPAPYGELIRHKHFKFKGYTESPLSKRAKLSSSRQSTGMHPNGVNGSARSGGHSMASLERKRKRRGSASSDSSLSSAMTLDSDDFPEDEDEEDEEGGSSVVAETIGSSSAANPPQPMTTRRKALATKPGQSPPSAPQSPTKTSSTQQQQRHQAGQQQQRAAAAATTATSASASAMPTATVVTTATESASQLFPNLVAKQQQQQQQKSAEPAVKFQPRFGTLDDGDARARMRRQAREISGRNDPAFESFARGGKRGGLDSDGEEDGGSNATRRQPSSSSPMPPSSSSSSRPRPLGLGPNLRVTRQGRRAVHDDAGGDEPVSPTSSLPPNAAADAPPSLSLPLGPPPPPAHVAADDSLSRADTPTTLRPARGRRTGPRVKTSPIKKKTNPSAGIPRASGERTSPAPNGASGNLDENDDYCSSCSGSGDLLCCDGCTRAFHFKCVDPPMEENQLPEEWFCSPCFCARYPGRVPDHTGAFGPLLNCFERKFPMAFSLPPDIRDYFEGVKTGPDGEYEEPAPVKPKNKKGYEETPDFFKLRDAEGNAIVCHNCNQSAQHRAMMQCSKPGCGLYWHLDCTDPPMAHPPPPRAWECPAHAEELLSSLGPAHRVRKVKGAPPIEQAFPRGMRNNGLIEVVDDDEIDDDDWHDYESFGRVYRLPARGIKLDFISQLRRHGAGYVNPRKRPLDGDVDEGGRPGSAGERPVKMQRLEARTTLTPTPAPMDARSVEEQQVALILGQLRQQVPDGIDTLLKALKSDIPSAVLDLIAQADASNIGSGILSSVDRQGLTSLLAFITKMLAKDETAAPTNGKQPSSSLLQEAAQQQSEQQQLSPQSLGVCDARDGDKSLPHMDDDLSQEMMGAEDTEMADATDAVTATSPDLNHGSADALTDDAAADDANDSSLNTAVPAENGRSRAASPLLEHDDDDDAAVVQLKIDPASPSPDVNGDSGDGKTQAEAGANNKGARFVGSATDPIYIKSESPPADRPVSEYPGPAPTNGNTDTVAVKTNGSTETENEPLPAPGNNNSSKSGEAPDAQPKTAAPATQDASITVATEEL